MRHSSAADPSNNVAYAILSSILIAALRTSQLSGF
jgi:hypothetical protein